MARLVVVAGPCYGQQFALSMDRRLLTIGREGTDIALPDPSVSRRHAELAFRDAQWIVQDLRSSNGTYVNGQRILRPRRLRHSDHIQCGSTVLCLETAESLVLGEEDSTVVAEDASLETYVGLDLMSLAALSAHGRRSEDRQIAEAGRRALDLSHGIKNILQAIQGGRDAVSLGLRGQDLEMVQKAWAILGRNLDMVQKLVLDLLQFSREHNPVFVRCDFNGIIKSAVGTLCAEAEKDRKELILQLDESIPPVRMDCDQIYDITVNLILNAIEAVAPNTGRITVKTQLAPTQDQVVLCVADNGIGVEDPESIFEPFYTTRPKKGVGLGLSIVQKIVTLHGGSVIVESEEGTGSIFTVMLPVSPTS